MKDVQAGACAVPAAVLRLLDVLCLLRLLLLCLLGMPWQGVDPWFRCCCIMLAGFAAAAQ